MAPRMPVERARYGHIVLPAPPSPTQPYAFPMIFDSAFYGMLALTLPVIVVAALYWVIRSAVRDGMRDAARDHPAQRHADISAP
jgi:hypothetical protein